MFHEHNSKFCMGTQVLQKNCVTKVILDQKYCTSLFGHHPLTGKEKEEIQSFQKFFLLSGIKLTNQRSKLLAVFLGVLVLHQTGSPILLGHQRNQPPQETTHTHKKEIQQEKHSAHIEYIIQTLIGFLLIAMRLQISFGLVKTNPGLKTP